MPKKKTTKEAKSHLEQHAKDWVMNDSDPTTPEVFDSMFTNDHGEKWWCRITNNRLVVWGDDVGGTATSTNASPMVSPWIMSAPEQLWLSANLARLQTRMQLQRVV
jgi:hypothetical protein